MRTWVTYLLFKDGRWYSYEMLASDIDAASHEASAVAQTLRQSIKTWFVEPLR